MALRLLAALAALTTAAAHAQQGAPPGIIGLGSPALNAPGGLASAAAPPAHAIEISGYAILAGSWIDQDPNFLAIGRNNGFTLADARIELTGKPLETVWLFLSLDGAVPLRAADDPLQGRRVVDLKDAYGIWAPGYHLRVQAGQFKAPQDLENLLEETELRFPSRSILSDGVHVPQGYEAEGLALDRQLGLALGTDVIPLPYESSLIAQVALTNGNGPNQLHNDTRYPSVVGRVSLGILGIASLGLDAYYQPRAFGTQPNLLREDRTGAGADLRVEWRGLHLLLLVQARTTKHLTTGAPDESAGGWSAEAAYRLWFIEPALRVTYLSPSNRLPSVPVTHTTAALNLYVPGSSTARLSLAFTHRDEQPGRELQNDGFELAAQVHF